MIYLQDSNRCLCLPKGELRTKNEPKRLPRSRLGSFWCLTRCTRKVTTVVLSTPFFMFVVDGFLSNGTHLRRWIESSAFYQFLGPAFFFTLPIITEHFEKYQFIMLSMFFHFENVSLCLSLPKIAIFISLNFISCQFILVENINLISSVFHKKRKYVIHCWYCKFYCWQQSSGSLPKVALPRTWICGFAYY